MLNILLNSVTLSGVTLEALFMLLVPLFIFFFLILFGRVFKSYRGITATVFMFVNALIALVLFFSVESGKHYIHHFNWIKVSTFSFDFGIQVDSLSALFALIVCFVSFLVHLFSIEYLRGDKNFEKYFSYLGLFTFSMLGIIFSENLLQMFVFWELVGFSSYLLIGFWYQKDKAISANKKAFVVNRVGDVGFLLGILVLFGMAGTLSFDSLYDFISGAKVSALFDFHYLVSDHGELSRGWLVVAALGICSGGLAKSAQLPFSVWLPNAMEGPTPVSALIHAATMVAAGIYLLARFTFLMPQEVLNILAVVGSLTALVAAITAITQTDIKKVLAYSTISQLGYMVLGIGVGGYDSALFHLLTHAFFKAALFLCAGAIIHSLHVLDTAYGIKKLYPDFDEQNMKQMGGLRTKMPWVFWVYTVALAGIIGVPFFSGFLSKDAILLDVLRWSETSSAYLSFVPVFAFLTVLLTAFYMTRQWFLVFFGQNRLSEQIANAPAGIQNFITKEKLDAPLLMKIPPVFLALLTLAPVFSFNPFSGDKSWIYSKLPVIEPLDIVLDETVKNYSHLIVSILSLFMMVCGVLLAFLMFKKGKLTSFKNKLNNSGFIHGLSYNFMHLDQVYRVLLVQPTVRFARFFTSVDKQVIDGAVDLSVKSTISISRGTARIDRKIIDAFVESLAVINVIFGLCSAFIDDYVVDGLVKLIAWFGKKIGGLAKVVHGGSLQMYILWSFAFALIVGIIIWLL